MAYPSFSNEKVKACIGKVDFFPDGVLSDFWVTTYKSVRNASRGQSLGFPS